MLELVDELGPLLGADEELVEDPGLLEDEDEDEEVVGATLELEVTGVDEEVVEAKEVELEETKFGFWYKSSR